MFEYLNTEGLEGYWSYLWTKNDKESRWFQLDNLNNEDNLTIQELNKYIESKKKNDDVYFSVSLFKEPTLKHLRGKAQDSAGIWGLWLDVDLRTQFRKRKDLPPNINEAMSLIDDSPFPPTIVVASGYGLQPWWLFKEPWLFNSQAEKLEAAKLCGAWNEWFRIKSLKRGWGLDGVSDLARVMRMPGTHNHKGQTITDVEIIANNDIYYNPSELSDMLPPEAWTAERGANDPSVAVNITLNHGVKTDTDTFAKLCANIDQFAQTWTHKKKLRDGSMSGYDLSIASYCVMAGLKDQDICDLLVCHAKEHNAEIKTPTYYERTIAKARQGGKIGVKPEEIHEVSNVLPLLRDMNAGGREEVQARKSEVLSLLSMILKIQVYDFIAYNTDPREYELITDKGRVKLHKGSDDLVSGPGFRKRVGDITSIYIDRFKTNDWDVISQSLRYVAREVDLGEDLTEEAQSTEWLRSYLNSKPAATEEQNNDAKINRRPFYEDGLIHFNLEDFRLWLTSRGERISSQRLASRLRRANMDTTNTYSSRGDRRTRHAVWVWKDDL